MLIINFEGREVKGLSKGRYDETFAGEDVIAFATRLNSVSERIFFNRGQKHGKLSSMKRVHLNMFP